LKIDESFVKHQKPLSAAEFAKKNLFRDSTTELTYVFRCCCQLFHLWLSKQLFWRKWV